MVEVFVERDPKPGQRPQGDWIVRVGRGRGGKIVSRHRQKDNALQRARREGRKREDVGATLLVEDLKGRPKKEAEYGDGHDPSDGGFLGLFG